MYSPTNYKHCPSAKKKKSPASGRAQNVHLLGAQLLRQFRERFCFLFFVLKEKMCEEKSFLCQEAGSDQNSWSEGREARSEPLSGSMNETLRRDRAWRRGLGAIWGTDCWNGCSHWCKVHPLFGLVPDSASNQRLWQQNFTHIKFGRGENRLSAQHLQNKQIKE